MQTEENVTSRKGYNINEPGDTLDRRREAERWMKSPPIFRCYVSIAELQPHKVTNGRIMKCDIETVIVADLVEFDGTSNEVAD